MGLATWLLRKLRKLRTDYFGASAAIQMPPFEN